MKKKEMVGIDRTCKPVYVGDTVQDAEGKKYTINERGRCKGQDGKEVDFSSLKGPELCADEQKPVAVADPAPEVKLLPKRKGGKENKSGLVQVGNIARAVAYHLGNGTAVLRKAGIEIVKDPATGKPCVRIQDKEAARELLASLVPPAGAVAIEADRVEITPEMRAILNDRTKTKKVPLAPILEQLAQEEKPEGPAVDYDALKEQEAEVAVRGILAQFEDKALAAELRRRGFEVTATKTVVVSL